MHPFAVSAFPPWRRVREREGAECSRRVGGQERVFRPPVLGESDMASAVRKIKLSLSSDIPFNKLVLSQSNVRRVKARLDRATGGEHRSAHRLQRRHCGRGLRQARDHYRDATGSDRPVACAGYNDISVASRRGAGRCHAAPVDQRVRSSTVADRDGSCRSVNQESSAHCGTCPRLRYVPVRHGGSHG